MLLFNYKGDDKNEQVVYLKLHTFYDNEYISYFFIHMR